MIKNILCVFTIITILLTSNWAMAQCEQPCYVHDSITEGAKSGPSVLCINEEGTFSVTFVTDKDLCGDPVECYDGVHGQWSWDSGAVASGTFSKCNPGCTHDYPYSLTCHWTTPGVKNIDVILDDEELYEADDDPESVRITVKVIKAEIKQFIFTSDHGVMTDWDTNYTYGGGTVYSPRGWVKDGANNPVSHTKDTYIIANVVICVEPAGVTFDLVGNLSWGSLGFLKTDQTSTGSDQTIAVTAVAKLPIGVYTLNESIDWMITNIDGTNKSCDAGTSGPHKMYITWGTPGTGPTVHRIKWACGMADEATSISSAAAKFSAAVEKDPGWQGSPVWNLNSWEFLDSGNSGDCIILAKLCKEGLGMIGIPATHRWAFPTHDGYPGWPAVSSSTCTTVTHAMFSYGGYDQWLVKAVYPGNNFEAFFTVNDPNIKAYTVWPFGGPFTNQNYYYLEVIRSVTNDHFWVIDGNQTHNGITLYDWTDIGADHWTPPAIP